MKKIFVNKKSQDLERICDCEYLASGYYEEKKSKFYSYIFKISSKEEALDIIQKLKQEYKDARHVVYAYVLDNEFSYSDDGEPSGTAGKMIYSLMEKQNIVSTLVIVVRYFGGILLGVGPLSRAYLKAVKDAEEKLEIVTYIPQKILEVECSYKDEPRLRNIILSSNADILNTEYAENVRYKLSINEFDEKEYNDFKII